MNCGQHTLEIELSEPAPVDLKVEFTVSGTATEDDYSIENNYFIVEQGSKIGSLVIDVKAFLDSKKELKITIVKAEGYDVGNCVFTYELSPVEKVMYSFVQKEQSLVEETNIVMVIAGETSGDSYENISDKKFVVSVDPSSSAIEGTHFEFVGEKTITISKDNLTGYVTIKPIGDSFIYLGKEIKLLVAPETGDDDPLYYAGSNIETRVVMTGFNLENVIGKWKLTSQVNYDFLVAMGNYESDLSSLPVIDESDCIEFAYNEDGESLIIPTLKGGLKNFFTNAEGHKISFSEIAGEFTHWETWEAYSLPFYTVDGVNAKFSATETEERPANIGLSYVDENTINVYVFDYVPTDFLTQMYEEMGYEFYADAFGLVYSFSRITE